ncbi:DUF2855 family protein [Ottowia testudinis]|uniref:DUF2855 family protein n=1 Tax=Ottowia testudinis TaxID=2816950 RepID=A0A975CHR6_9BURK|nr:DUF2855 family protein [Ottowia testudinis]QTD45311.1 DUF2855 family protein [Ottowia testudinis]
MLTTELLVQKNNLATTRVRKRPNAPLQPGQVRARVDRFALTANNITYAAFGSAMHYWDFYPVQDLTDAGAEWGIVPVWGFGTVVESACAEVPVGERLYGFWPMASHAVLAPAHVTHGGWSDGAAHRSPLPAIYNQYLRTSADPFYTEGTEDLQALLRPLFATSWLIDDFMADNGFFGASTLLLSSASSKTAYATAFCLAQRPGIEVIGLTSPGNMAFCEQLGCYSRVLAYDALPTLDGTTPTVYIDFAGNAGLRKSVHGHFTQLRYSCSVGGAHVGALGHAKDLPGPRATLFFAPAQGQKRAAEWGQAVFGQRLLDGWNGFLEAVQRQAWVRVAQANGPAAAQAAYAQMLAGHTDPGVGTMVSLSSA